MVSDEKSRNALVCGIDHVAIVVRDIDQAIKLYENVLGLKITHRETLDDDGIHVAFIQCGKSFIELMEPFDENCYTAKILKKNGQSVAHICFETSDVDEVKDRLQEEDFIILGEGIRNGAQGRRVIFLHPKDNCGVLTEFSQPHVDAEEKRYL